MAQMSERTHAEQKLTGRIVRSRLMMIPLLVVVVGCHKKATEGGPRIEQISDAFAAAGLAPENFAPTDATRFHAARCYQGQIDGVEALVCEYGSPDALALGKQAGEQWAA